MRKVTIRRNPSTDAGTFGQLWTDKGFTCITGELPYRNNLPGKSCIPVGTYTVRNLFSPAHNMNLYHVLNVPHRGDVEIHSGNWCGDVDKGLKSDVLGCILLGNNKGLLIPPGMKAQMAVINSTSTVQLFMDHMNDEDFTLTIS